MKYNDPDTKYRIMVSGFDAGQGGVGIVYNFECRLAKLIVVAVRYNCPGQVGSKLSLMEGGPRFEPDRFGYYGVSLPTSICSVK